MLCPAVDCDSATKGNRCLQMWTDRQTSKAFYCRLCRSVVKGDALLPQNCRLQTFDFLVQHRPLNPQMTCPKGAEARGSVHIFCSPFCSRVHDAVMLARKTDVLHAFVGAAQSWFHLYQMMDDVAHPGSNTNGDAFQLLSSSAEDFMQTSTLGECAMRLTLIDSFRYQQSTCG